MKYLDFYEYQNRIKKYDEFNFNELSKIMGSFELLEIYSSSKEGFLEYNLYNENLSNVALIDDERFKFMRVEKKFCSKNRQIYVINSVEKTDGLIKQNSKIFMREKNDSFLNSLELYYFSDKYRLIENDLLSTQMKISEKEFLTYYNKFHI